MFDRIQVKDFQSIAEADLKLDKFTVLVGPSSSGKSALFRAARSLVRNTFVPANVRQGALKAVVEVKLNGAKIRSERGKSLSTYYLNDSAYPKSGKSVPEDVVNVLKMPAHQPDPFFSFQFDRPFLVSETGSVAAFVIGSLTQVSVLHAAVREANRRRGAVAALLRTREGDRVNLEERLEAFKFLPSRQKALERAREALQSAEELRSVLVSLRDLTAALEASEAFLSTFELPEVPYIDFDPVEKDIEERNIIRLLVDDITKGLTLIKRYEKIVSDQADAIGSIDEGYAQILEEEQICPTCGRPLHD